ncbi:hypothetical protein [Listeria seeligeri]|uniref:hypothetical protein n=1 Tax=Listeria seeligeri TaxID=1640 RepID=UPI001E6222B1|nr:hypothetical protein [Listeria seeligeri]
MIYIIPLAKVGKYGAKGFKFVAEGMEDINKLHKKTDKVKEVEKSTKKASGVDFGDIIKKGEKMPNHSVVKNKNSLPGKREPNSSADLLNPDGSVKQRRYYDEKGRAKEDIDFNHSDDGTHEFPHRHEWDWDSKPPRKPSK